MASHELKVMFPTWQLRDIHCSFVVQIKHTHVHACTHIYACSQGRSLKPLPWILLPRMENWLYRCVYCLRVLELKALCNEAFLLVWRWAFTERGEAWLVPRLPEVATWQDKNSRMLALSPYLEWVDRIPFECCVVPLRCSWVHATVVVCLPQRIQFIWM